MANFRDHSKGNWASSGSTEHINAGSLQRIADASEKMASNYTQLQSEKEMYERWYRNGAAENRKLYRRIAALQGVITRMKKKKPA